jgi:hypothetical protein
MECSFAAHDEKLVFLDSSILDGIYLHLREDDGSSKGKDLCTLLMDDDDLDILIRMLNMVKRQREEEMALDEKRKST